MSMGFKAAGRTDQGMVRKNNEDAVWVDPSAGLLVVADGMGGHQSGEVASGMAVTTIPEHFKLLSKAESAGQIMNKRLSPEANRLGSCVKMANQMIYEAARKYPKDKGMGCTCTAALIHGDRVGVAHVGDSRAYLIRRGEMEQLTRDHSLVMDQVRQGLITKEEAAKSSLQNILTRALGTQPDVEVDVDEHPLFADDVLLLCSDGLFKELTDEQILKLAVEHPEPQELVESLIERANAAGGRDNVTVAAARMYKTGFADRIKSFFGLTKPASHPTQRAEGTRHEP